MAHVVFVALGSRGDVQPLAVLASAVADVDAVAQVSLVSHSELQKLTEEPEVWSSKVLWRPLAQPCFVHDGRLNADTPDVLDLQGRRRAEWIEAIGRAGDADVLVCNLFAMPPVFHLAERLKIPWICCSPSLIPYSMPETFEQELTENMPDLMEVLKKRDEPGDESLFSWSTVKSWMWPVFTESHAILREEFLGLPPVPGDRAGDGHDHFAPETLKGAQFLLGIPAALIPASVTLPPAAVVCGAWSPAEDRARKQPKALVEFLAQCEEEVAKGQLTGPPFYIGFGSMGAEGLVPDAEKVLKVFLDTAKWMARPVVLMQHTLAQVDPTPRFVFCCSEDVPHGWKPSCAPRCADGSDLCRSALARLFPQCSVVIHHGGIGTVLAAARVGRPQLVVPLAFDQPFWGQTLEDLGVAAVQELEELSVPLVARKLRALLTPSVQRSVEDLAAQLNDESPPIARAVQEIAALAATVEGAGAGGAGREVLRPVHRIELCEDAEGEAEELSVLGRSSGEVQFIFREIAEEHSYGELSKLPGDSIVVDGGMNLGLFSLVLAKRWRGTGQLTVVAFEPAEETYHLALQNLRHHGVPLVAHGAEFGDRDDAVVEGAEFGDAPVVVHCFRLALCDVEREDRLCYFPYLTSSSTLQQHRAAKDLAKERGCFDPRLVQTGSNGLPAMKVSKIADMKADAMS
ncbi:unnamed protein product [Durusdinium trenchii]|uniref:Erythromycin biosynthesis protein CIII-like C-terminal domain-containing protein n=1 Tax=Durusdinium trenchii TaxID=1381693 RepID=A0ABP0KNW7_9DINO